MSELTILRGNGQSLTLDVVESADFVRTVILPRHPVDPGSNAVGPGRAINDSAVLEPKDFTVRCMISELAPVGAPANPRREEDAIDFLEAIVGEYVTVFLPKFRAIEDVQLAAFPYALDRYARTPFSLTFSAVGFATRTTRLLAPIAKVAPRAKPSLPERTDDGAGTTTTASEEKARDVAPSLLKRAGKALGGEAI